MILPPVIVTNFKRRITGVTSTAINVTRRQQDLAPYKIGLCGPKHGLKLWQALMYGFRPPKEFPFRIWHVRRNSEMAWGLFAKHILRQPIRLIFTSAAIRRHSPYPRWLISKMDALVATSDQAAALLDRVDLVQGHGVDTRAFQPGTNQTDAKTSPIRITCIGRIRPEKGVHILVEALCQVLPSHPGVQMHFIGKVAPAHQAFFQEQQRKLTAAGIAAQITWHDEIPATEVAAHLATSHILAATPLYEGYGLTAFEGLASGCAVLLSDTGAFREATAQGETGELVPLSDVPKTAAALGRLLADPRALTIKQRRAREIAVTHFDLDQEASALLTLYDRIFRP